MKLRDFDFDEDGEMQFKPRKKSKIKKMKNGKLDGKTRRKTNEYED
jgi:hypothetical protein